LQDVTVAPEHDEITDRKVAVPVRKDGEQIVIAQQNRPRVQDDGAEQVKGHQPVQDFLPGVFEWHSPPENDESHSRVTADENDDVIDLGRDLYDRIALDRWLDQQSGIAADEAEDKRVDWARVLE
jgi:hypothetical protein